MDGRLPAFSCAALLEFYHGVHRHLPRTCGNVRIARSEICAGNLQVNGRLLFGFILGVKNSQRLGPIACFQTDLFARDVVMPVKPPTAFPSIQSESLVHTLPFGYESKARDSERISERG